MLWCYIKEDLVKQIKEIQAFIKKDIIQDFHNFLQENRVFIPINGGNIGDNIQEYIIDAKEEHKWTPQEIKIEHQIRATKKFNSRGNSNNGQL